MTHVEAELHKPQQRWERPAGALDSVPSPRAPATPHRARQRAALSALDLLLSLAPPGAPLPDDPGSLRYLARHDHDDAPGLETPDWLIEACEAHGIEPEGGWCGAPTREGARETRPQSCASCESTVESAYTHGILSPEDLLDILPAHLLLALPHNWRRRAFAGAWRRVVAGHLERELGADTDAWLRLAAAATEAERSGRTSPDHRCGSGGGPGGGATWPELVARSRTGAPTAADPADGIASAEGLPPRTPAPATPEEALRLLGHGNHLWSWPAGTLLCLAEPEVIAALLPRLGPDAPWLLAAYLLRHDRTPPAAFEQLLKLRDPAALRVLATQSRWLSDAYAARLADLRDPEVDLALLRNSHRSHLLLSIAMRPGPLVPVLLGALRSDPAALPPGGTLWLRSTEPDLIEAVFARTGGQLSLAQQLVGCLNLLRSGGPRRLSALVTAGHLGRAATRLCQKALAGPDPLAVIRARTALELSAAKLAKRLRLCERPWDTAEVLRRLAAEPDWDALEAEHKRDPLPHWDQVVNLPDAPLALKLRHARLLPEPAHDRLPLSLELTRARLRHGVGGPHHQPLTRQLDVLLEAGHLSGHYLVHEAAPATLVLWYLNAALRRADAPARIPAAVEAAAALVRDRLGTDREAWRRVTARLTERDPDWDPLAPVASLLTP
ncbi:hypothetical protein ABZ532_24745 [Streptomyces sp. NPDC019396]|uniref:hypothetical protein n=1 Tax=Streptomyces sp. NPDC019396 TaxID=3154687 RepID=UPI00340FF7FB